MLKRILIAFVALMTIVPTVSAETASKLMELGFSDEQAKRVASDRINTFKVLNSTGTPVAQITPSTGTFVTAGGVTASGAMSATGGLMLANEAVAGAGTTQGTAAALSATKFVHRITGANGTVGWRLPSVAAAKVGEIHILLNTTAGVALVYPATGGTINGAAANGVFTALTGIKPIICVVSDAETWLCA